MAKEISIIRQEAQQVQNATQVGENTAQRVGGVLTDIVDKAEEHETDIDNLNANTGVDEYPTFSTAEDYKSGDTVNYQGKLYQFTTDHAAGAWTGSDVEETDVVNAHIVQELGDSEDKVVSQKTVTEELTKIRNNFNQTVVSDNEKINSLIKEIYCPSLSKDDEYTVRLYNRAVDEKWDGTINLEIKKDNTNISTINISKSGLQYNLNTSHPLYIYAEFDDNFLNGQIHKSADGVLILPSSLNDCPRLNSVLNKDLLSPKTFTLNPDWQVRTQSGYYMDIPYIPNASINLYNQYNVKANYIFRIECYNFENKKLTEDECGINPDITYDGITLPQDKYNLIKYVRVIISTTQYNSGYTIIELSNVIGTVENVINRLHILETADIISNVSINGVKLNKDEDNMINIPSASNTQDGVMTKEDKAKLDKLDENAGGTTINIEGSGITKNASAYGFLPTNDAATNTANLQSVVNGGGTILVDLAGTYEINNVIQLDDNTTLIFGANVFIKKTASYPVFINKGAFTRTYNTNIQIIGLHLICNGKSGYQYDEMYGLFGHIEFFYIKNLIIDKFYVDDLPSSTYAIHVCTFENVQFTNCIIRGEKDGLHFGRGNRFVIRHCRFSTKDDAIALNSYDYDIGNPELGIIENGIIDDCVFEDNEYEKSLDVRISASNWPDWTVGMKVQKSDTVVYNGKMYRVIADPDGTLYTSNTPPDFESGKQVIDGITWYMAQSNDVTHQSFVRNVKFSNILVEHTYSSAFIYSKFADDNWCRGYYQGEGIPCNYNLQIDNIITVKEVGGIIGGFAPVDYVIVRNSKVNGAVTTFSKKTSTNLYETITDSYPSKIFEILDGNYYMRNGTYGLIPHSGGDGNMRIKAKISNSIYDDDFKAEFAPTTDLLTNDLPIDE